MFQDNNNLGDKIKSGFKSRLGLFNVKQPEVAADIKADDKTTAPFLNLKPKREKTARQQKLGLYDIPEVTAPFDEDFDIPNINRDADTNLDRIQNFSGLLTAYDAKKFPTPKYESEMETPLLTNSVFTRLSSRAPSLQIILPKFNILERVKTTLENLSGLYKNPGNFSGLAYATSGSEPVPAQPKKSLMEHIRSASASLRQSDLVQHSAIGLAMTGASLRQGATAQASSLSTAVKNVGAALKDPKIIAQSAKAIATSLKDPKVLAELGLNVGVMTAAKVAGGLAIGALHASVPLAFAAMTATTGIVGGILQSRKQYMAHQKTVRAALDAGLDGFDFKANEDAKIHEIDAGFKQSVGKNYKNFASYLLNNKAQLGKNMLKSAFNGAVGGSIGVGIGHLVSMVSHIDLSSLVSHDAVKEAAATAAATHKATTSAMNHTAEMVKQQTDAATTTASVHTPPAAPAIHDHMTKVEAQQLKDHAVKLYNGIGMDADKDQAIQEFLKAAQEGNKQAARDYFKITGHHYADAVLKETATAMDSSPAIIPAAAPDVAPMAPSIPVTPPPIDSELAGKAAIAVGTAGAVGIGATVIAPHLQGAIAAAALGTSQMKDDALTPQAPVAVTQVIEPRQIGTGMYVNPTVSVCQATADKMVDNDAILVTDWKSGEKKNLVLKAKPDESVSPCSWMMNMVRKGTLASLFKPKASMVANDLAVKAPDVESSAAVTMLESFTPPLRALN